MSKYNLIDIFEQYQIGSGWTNDFDYDGMLNAGLNVSVDTNIETLKKIFEDFTDVNYHREAEHLHYAIEAIEGGDIFEAEGKLNDFFAAIQKTQEEQGTDTSDDLGAYMASKMEENEAVDLAIEASQEKAGIKEVSSREGSRIEGLLSIPLKAKFLEAFQDLYFDLVEEDPFMAEDVVDHLGIEMLKHLDAIQAQGDSLAGLDQQEFTAIDEEDSIEEALPKFKGVPEQLSILRALRDDGKGTKMEIQSYMESLKRSGDEFDEVDDYVEDFKNYVADKALQEHFGRFMKDYQ